MAKTLLVLVWATATALWILGMTRWKQRTLERFAAGSPASFWLRVFRIPENDANRARLLIYGSSIGIAVITIMTLVVLLLGVP